MKASELTISDWVLDTEFERNEPDRIGIVEDDGRVWLKNRNSYQSVTYCAPILLSPEILKKNGFKLKEENETRTIYVSVDENSIISFAFYKETMYDVDTLLKCELNLIPVGLNSIHHCHTKYVHQLQHALRLCGIEKDIEL